MVWCQIWLSIIVSIVVRVYTDNPTSIVPPLPGPDPGYIVAESNSGLSNRLRVLAGYMYVGEKVHNGAHLAFIWDKNSACPGAYLSIFDPIPNVIFATGTSRHVLGAHAKAVYENTTQPFRVIMQMYDIPKNRYGHESWNDIERRMYSKFVPTREVMAKAARFVEKYNMCNSSAMHMRTTDLDKNLPKRIRLSINNYFKFVDSRPAEEKVFLLTDDPKTQRIFLDKYGKDKIIVYSEIAEEKDQQPVEASQQPDSNGGGSSTSTQAAVPKVLAEDHRYTTLEHTLIDVIIAAHAKAFRPSSFSSLSELVRTFEMIGKGTRGWCQSTTR